MFGFGKKKQDTDADQEPGKLPHGQPLVPEDSEPTTNTSPPKEKRPGLFGRLREKLSRTRTHLGDGMANLLLGKKDLDEELLEELETRLLMADVGIEATEEILSGLPGRLSRRESDDP
ncbi:MAG: signal recognition particle-docking protein FtsY, partial [Gammaproteobacteria bacterium]|nr:signal recognition particle-docking protein FtsY [Gammaproteobacteria bacterium]